MWWKEGNCILWKWTETYSSIPFIIGAQHLSYLHKLMARSWQNLSFYINTTTTNTTDVCKNQTISTNIDSPSNWEKIQNNLQLLLLVTQMAK